MIAIRATVDFGSLQVSLDPASAANAIDEAFRRKTTLRRHLCPLDLSDELPPLRFGSARVAQFSADDLASLFDAPRLARNFPNQPLDVKRLSQFHWLVVEDEIELDPRPEARTAPFMYMTFDRDFGEIDPHLGRFPPSVEAALFFLLLAPWEQWSTMQEVDWRGFRVPFDNRRRAKLMEIKEELRRRMHQPVPPEQGRWLRQVVTGFFNYHAVPTNGRALAAFRHHVGAIWYHTLRRRSQRDRTSWEWTRKLANDWLPQPRTLHPWPSQRFAVKHPRWEPDAGIPHVRICAGGAQQ